MISFGLVLWAVGAGVPAEAGERLTLEDKVFQADSIVEVVLPLDQPIPKSWPNKTYDPKRAAFPHQLHSRAMKQAKVERVLKVPKTGKPPTLPKQYAVFSIGSPCWWKAHAKGGLRTLVFLRLDRKGRHADLAEAEHETGLYSDLNPDYELMVRAIRTLSAWQEQSQPGPVRREEQKKILSASHDPYQLYLTVAHLKRQDPDMLDEVWGPRGSSTRTQYEKIVTEPAVEGLCRMGD